MQKHLLETNGSQPSAPAPDDAFIDERELLRRVPVSAGTLANWRKSGKLPHVRLTGSHGRIIYDWVAVRSALLRHQRASQ
jgi:predicted site-specific integrase-resolvase